MSVENTKKQILTFKDQLHFFELGSEIKNFLSSINTKKLKGIIISGMGGSALSGEFLRDYLYYRGFNLPIFIFRRYDLPPFVDTNYLIFIQSYSGNTEETLSMLNDALRKNLKIITISSNGKLKKISKEQNLPFIQIPQGFQPRLSVGYFFMAEFTLINYLFDLHLDNDFKQIEGINWQNVQQEAEQLVKNIKKIPLIYAPYSLRSVAYIWKALINECSKIHCFVNEISELNHNEMVGFTLSRDFDVIFLEDISVNERIKKRILLLKRILKNLNVNYYNIYFDYTSFLARLLSLIYFGMWFSFYLAIRNNVDPEEVKIIEDFKKQLDVFNIFK